MNPMPKISAETQLGNCGNTSAKAASCSFSSGIVAWNDDLWMEILLRLPAKSLIRFKSVSKFWLSLISSLNFSCLHNLRHPKLQPSLLLQTGASYFFYFHPILQGAKLIPYHFTLTDPKILNSCNGLLLLQCGDPQKDYYIFNPTTRQSRKIFLTNNDKYNTVLGLSLAFDPSKSPHYKVVCIRATRKSSPCRLRICQIEVYESKTASWKLCIEEFTASTHVKFAYGAHWNDVIHWENRYNGHLYFDIDKNVMGNTPDVNTPWREGGGGAACHCHLQESNGHFQHFIIISHHGDKSVAVLELKADYSEWLLKYHDTFGQLPGRFRVLSFIRGVGEETCTLVYHIPGEITAYRFLDKTFKKLVDLKNEPFYKEEAVQFEPRDVYQFSETLAPV